MKPQILLSVVVAALGAAPLALSQATNTQEPVAANQETGEPILLQFPGGDVAVGHLLSHEEAGLRFQVARHGGIVSLPWEALHAPQSEALRRRFGYIAEETEELLIPVERLVLVNGQEVTGVILERSGSQFVVKSEGNTQAVPKSRVVSVAAAGLAPALSVYQTEELYAQGLAKLQPEDALSHVQLAEYCERILDFPHAVQHYAQAIALVEGEQDTALWQRAAERAGVKAKQADQLERLREVDRLRRRNLFAQAFEKIAAFHQAYPNTPFGEELNKANNLVEKTQKRVVAKTITERWYYRAKQLTRSMARSKDATFDGLVARLDGDFGDLIAKAVTADVQKLAPGITPEQVTLAFQNRKKGRWRVATYGAGTWLLGSERAQAGLKKADRKEEKKEEASAPDTEFQKRVEAYLQNQRRRAAQGMRGSQEQVQERNQTWQTLSLDARASWLLSYYAEFGGAYDAQPGIAHLCRQCGGSGALESLNAGLSQSQGGGRGRGRGGVQGSGGPRIEKCGRCHGEQIVRRVRFR